jgi:hypothetical protein
MDEQDSSESARELRSAADRVREIRKATLADNPADLGMFLDVRDTDQRALVEARLRYIGKTRTNSPNLFARLDKNSMASKSDQTQQVTTQDCSSPLSITQDPNNLQRWEARIITSCFSGADYSYVDLFWWNSVTGEVLKYDHRENFANPTDLTLEIIADDTQIGTTIQVDSMSVNSRGSEDTYSYGEHIQERPTLLARADQVFLPKDTTGDGVVTSCLDRGGTDCDYYYSNTGGNIMLPISMSFRFPKSVSSVVSVVSQIHMTNSGGVCNTIDLKDHTTFSAGVVTINTNGPVSFGNRCVANQAKVRFWVMVVARTSDEKLYKMFWANDRANDSKNFPLQFRWSCLAEGSKIVMADGTEKPIEKVELGERVSSGASEQSLTVVDITSGFESAPIVELESDQGGALLVTQGHPFFDTSGRALRADELKVGSVIKTSSGTAKITKLNRKPYAGKVYNLKLGTEPQIQGLDIGAINMYANGFSVGDSRSQWALEMLRLQQASSAPIKEEWKQDQLMHNVRQFLAPHAKR